jgi:hypothetical protein
MGLDLGFEETKQFKLLACVEKVQAFRETIRCNRDAGRLGNRDLRVYGDICQLQPDKVMADLGSVPTRPAPYLIQTLGQVWSFFSFGDPSATPACPGKAAVPAVRAAGRQEGGG